MRSKSIDKMNKISSFINDYFIEYHSTPSIREIGAGTNLSKSTVQSYLVDMDRKGMLTYTGQTLETEFIKKYSGGNIKAAILGSVSCGIPTIEEENIQTYISLPEAIFGKGEFYILKANGDSMIDAGIDDGDLVIVRKQLEAKEGDIIVALVENEVTLKRFFLDREHNRVRLHPENKTMKDIFVNQCIIQGVAIKVLKDLGNI